MSGDTANRAAALRRAKELGCAGAHQHPNGTWMACKTHEEYERLENEQEKKSVLSRMRDYESVRERKGRKKKSKNKKNWEELSERGVIAIDTMSGGGLVSGAVGGKAASSIPFDGDEDVFTDINSARRRARQMGCIGVARRRSTGGNTVWTPCSNITDYARRTGSTALGRRYRDRLERQRARRILEEEQDRLGKKKPRRKVSLNEELYGKSLGRALRSAQPYDPKALDGDNDGLIQDSTAFERPAVVRKVGKAVKKATKTKKSSAASWEKLIASDPGWYSEAPPSVRKALSGDTVDKYRELRSGMRSGRVGSGGREATSKIINRVAPEHRNKPGGARTLHFVGGTTGSGKTTLVEDGTLDVPASNAAAFIDPDWIKTQLEGWDGGRGAAAVHPASRAVTDRAMDAAREAGTDVVVTGTGKRTEHLKWARNNGYATVGHFVYIPGAEADRRLASRNAINKASGGPVLPGWFGSQIAGELQPIVPRQITSNMFDDFYLWNNSVQPPSLIAKRTRDGAFEINDDKSFDDFFGSTGSNYVRNRWKSAQQNPPQGKSEKIL